jgi:hypothetical protein
MTNTALAEQMSSAAPAHLDSAMAGKLLREYGYDLVERFGHVHATRDAREWHLCLVADLVSMPPAHLLACLDEALTLRVEPSIVLSSHA